MPLRRAMSRRSRLVASAAPMSGPIGNRLKPMPEKGWRRSLDRCRAALAQPLGLLLDVRRAGGPTMRPLRESTPVWVWITIGLMALGSLAYAGAVWLAEDLMSVF